MKRYGLIGKKLSHTFSPAYFRNKFERENIKDASYEIFELEYIHDVLDLFKIGIEGLNVTIPYKASIIPFLDSIDSAAMEIGAVNCIKKTDKGYKGYNTDVYGFKVSLEKFTDVTKIRSALILGNGGAAQSVRYVLNQIGISFKIVTRNGNLSYSDITPNIIKDNLLIINTTPLGMYPNVEDYPLIDYSSITNQHLLYDVIYNPEKTMFLKKGEQQGASIKNGYEMLILQAENSWQIWNQA
jgi:shikimate dehydrogenase